MKEPYDVDYGDNVKEIYRDGQKTVLQMENETGVGTMTQWSLFPGIIIMQNDFRMDFCQSRFKTDIEMICIDHCREGRIEWELSERACFYVEAGDLNITARRRHAHSFILPLGRYHGFTIAIVPELAAEHLPGMLGGLPIDFHALRDRFCSDDAPFIAVSGKLKGLDLSGMYTMPEENRLPYYRIKTLEILMYLAGMEVTRDTLEGRYFYRTQVQKVKSIMKFMTENIGRHYTMEDLSKRFDIPMTAMKQCFRGVYGDSIYSYMRSYRMNAAAVLLRSTADPVLEIAAQMGYDNASKFSAAFKAVLGETPREYRRSHTIF